MKRFAFLAILSAGSALLACSATKGQNVGFDVDKKASNPVVPSLVVPAPAKAKLGKLILIDQEGEVSHGIVPYVKSAQSFTDGKKMRWTFEVHNKEGHSEELVFCPEEFYIADENGNVFKMLGKQYENNRGNQLMSKKVPLRTRFSYYIDVEAPKIPTKSFIAYFSVSWGGHKLASPVTVQLNASIPEDTNPAPKPVDTEPAKASPKSSSTALAEGTPARAEPMIPTPTPAPVRSRPATVFVGSAKRPPAFASVRFSVEEEDGGIIKAEVESQVHTAIEGKLAGMKTPKGVYVLVTKDGETIRLKSDRKSPEIMNGTDTLGWQYTISQETANSPKPKPAVAPVVRRK